MTVTAMIQVKRAYDPAEQEDGFRVLVDRLWPRGLSKRAAALGGWMKEVAPSAALRKWFGHDPAKWDEFCARYADELARRPDDLATLRERVESGTVTLLYAAKDIAHNNAVALKRYLEGVR